MYERILTPVYDPLRHVAVHDTTCFTFRVDAVCMRSQNRNRRRAEPARIILGAFDPSTPCDSVSD